MNAQYNPNVQGMISQAFGSETYVKQGLDIQHTPVYDTVAVAAGGTLATNTQFFTNVGQASGKTYADTNMTKSQSLPAPEAFAVMGLRLHIMANTLGGTILQADLVSLYQSFALEFWVGSKCYHRAPLWAVPAGGGISGFGATTVAATTISGYSNGLPSRESMHRLAIPVTIETNATFYAQLVGTASITLTAAAAGQGVKLQLLLEGFYARGIQ